MSRRRALIASATAAVLLLLIPASAGLAHDPGEGSPSWQKPGGRNLKHPSPSLYRWSGFGSDPLVKAGVKRAIEVGWADPGTNNSNSIRFDFDADGAATVFFSTTTQVTACNATAGWQGCAWLIDPARGLWKIWLRRGLAWCENGLVRNCILAERVAIHEIAHVGGFLEDSEGSRANTVMQSANGAPRYPDTGWDRGTLQRCDEARMQMNYDVLSTAGPYADCFDHVPNHGTFGMKTDLSVGSTTYQACVGDVVVATGRLQIHPGRYGRELGNPPSGAYHLDANPLTNRVVSIWRDGTPFGTVIASAASGDNWARAFSSAFYGRHDFVAQFDRDANTALLRRGLDSSPARRFSITWVPRNLC